MGSPTIRRADVALLVALGVVAVIGSQASRQLGPLYPWAAQPGWLASLAALTPSLAPVLTRRRYPVASLAVASAGLSVVRLLHVPETLATGVALFLTFQATGRWAADPWRNRVRWLSVVGLLLVLVIGLREERRFLTDDLVPVQSYYLASAVGVAFNLAFLAAAWWLGDVDRIRAEREHELAARTRELEIEREANARRAVLSERLRIARELHDVVAHHVSVMGIQAGAARRVGRSEPERVGEALEAIETSSRNAVVELQRLLQFLRSDGTAPARPPAGSGPDRHPVPGLGQLPALRRHLADAGLACTYEVVGEERELPPTVDLSAYRIVQESLTNVLKHAATDRASLRLSYGADALTIEVTDHGGRSGKPPLGGQARAGADTDTGTGTGTGTGIRGMEERAALVGGQLSAGPVDGGGFIVSARLPYDARASEAGPSADRLSP